MRIWLIFAVFFLVSPAFGAATGRAAAAKYFAKDVRQLKVGDGAARSVASTNRAGVEEPYTGEHRLGLSGGAFLRPQSQKGAANVGAGWGFSIDYQEMGSPGDFIVHGYQLGLHSFEQAGNPVQNVSFLWTFRFPKEHISPVYIGLAMGPGYFVKQSPMSSWLSVSGKGFVGLRLARRRSQFFIEAGINNHFLVLSRGFYRNWFLNSGVSFTF